MMHQRVFTDLSQDGRGLMILNRGLPAVEVTRGSGGAQIALTLLRSVGWRRDDLATRRVAAGPLVRPLARNAWAPTASSMPCSSRRRLADGVSGRP